MWAYMDEDGVVRLDPRVEWLLDEIAEPPVCSWCAVEVFRAQGQAGLTWVHTGTGLLVCSGQVTGGWGALREAAPSELSIRTRGLHRVLTVSAGR